jgi:hypothetical protein
MSVFRESIVFSALILALAMSSSPRAADQVSPAAAASQQPSTAGMAGMRYILENTHRGGAPYVLNLADQKQYDYVLDTLARTGATKDNRPEIFRSLERAHQKGQAGPPLLHPAYDRKIPPAQLPGRLKEVFDTPANPQNTVLISLLNDASTPSNRQYVSHALASAYGGAYHVVTLLNLAAQQNQQVTIFANNRTEQIAPNQPIFPASLLGFLPNAFPVGTNVLANSITMVWLTPTSSTPITVSSSWEDSVDSSDACLQAPTYKAQQGSGRCVNKGTIIPPLQVCWARGSPDSCDYYNTTAQPTSFVFPLQGNATFPSAVMSPATGDAALTLVVASGGGCVLTSTTGALLQGYTVGGTGNTVLSWNFPAASFPNPTHCLGAGGVITNLNLNVAVTLTNGQYGSFSMTSDTTQNGQPATYIIPQLNIVWGCVAEGTLVTLADGSKTPIERLKGHNGALVLSRDGSTRVIEDMTKGGESEPMFVISDDRGDSLKLTQSHPVFTRRGILPAHDIKIGDVVTTPHGEALITRVRQEMSKGLVYNLRLGGETDAAAGQTAMFANGILVGDVSMQRLMDTKAAAAAVSKPAAWTAETIARDAPERWRKDLSNSLRGE